MAQHAIDDLGPWSEDVLGQLIRISSEENGDKFAEVAGEHGVELFLFASLEELEEPVEEDVVAFGILDLGVLFFALDGLVLFLNWL